MGARADALYMKLPTYEGKPCTPCALLGMHNTTRYSSNGGCIACAQRRNCKDPQGYPDMPAPGEWMQERADARRAHEIALRCGALKYEGMMCRTCGLRERFVSSRACTHCTNERNKARSKERTERKRALYHSPVMRVTVSDARTCEHTAAMNQVLPELLGASLVYARCSQTEHLMGGKPHYGRCVMCYPDALINISNQIAWGNLPGLDSETVSFIMRLCKTPFTSASPYSLATLCMAEYNRRLGQKPAPKLPPLPLPGGQS